MLSMEPVQGRLAPADRAGSVGHGRPASSVGSCPSGRAGELERLSHRIRASTAYLVGLSNRNGQR